MGNPKIRCDVCDRELAQSHLKRHRGTIDCVRLHYQRAEARKHVIPPGFSSVYWVQEKFLWWAFGKAGFDVKTTPLSMKTIWRYHEAPEPTFATLAPTWAAQATAGVCDIHAASAMDVVVLAEHLHKDESIEKVEGRLALSAEIELTCCDQEDGLRTVDPLKVLRVLRRWASAAMGGTFPDS